MCRYCDAGDEHTLLDCEDAVTLLHGDPSARRLVADMRRRMTEVEELRRQVGFD